MKSVFAFFAFILLFMLVSFQNCGSSPRFESVNSTNPGPQATGTICPAPSPWPFTWKHITLVQRSGLTPSSYMNTLHLGLALYDTGGVINASFRQNMGQVSEVSCFLNIDLNWLDLSSLYSLSQNLNNNCQESGPHVCLPNVDTEAWYLAQSMPDLSDPTVGYDKMGYYPGKAPCTDSVTVCPSAPEIRAFVKQKIDATITPAQRASCPSQFLDTL